MLLRQLLISAFVPILLVLSRKCCEKVCESSESSECENSVAKESTKDGSLQTAWQNYLALISSIYGPSNPWSAQSPTCASCPNCPAQTPCPTIPPGPTNPGIPQGPSIINTIINSIVSAITSGVETISGSLPTFGSCEPPEQFDATVFRWNPEICELECNSPPVACTLEGQVYDSKVCGCVCPNEAEITKSCQQGQIFSPKNGCKCIFPCDKPQPAEGCPAGQIWSLEECKCMCDPPTDPKTCGPNQHLTDDECACECNTPLDCEELFPYRGYAFNRETCQCGCRNENPGNCRQINPLWDWSDVRCRCECANYNAVEFCGLTTSLQQTVWDPNTCRCECAQTLECDPALFTGYNRDTCECDCINKPPPAGCPYGEAWNRRICACEGCGGKCAPQAVVPTIPS